MTTRVLVADDQSMVRAGFRMLLGGEEDMEVVAEASNGLEAVEKAARFDPTVVLMDIRMPELDGLEATRRILAADNGARILILTTFDLDEYPIDAVTGEETVAVVADRLAAFGASAREAIDTATELGDMDTADLFTEVSRAIDKHLWFVEAHLQA